MTVHTSSWKKAQLAELTKLANEYPILAVVNLNTFPASLFQVLRKKLEGKAEIRASKTRVIRKALQNSSIDSSKLNDYVQESVAIIFTSMDPFELYAFAKKNKGNVSAKEGDIAPVDIVVPAGDTGLPPGPALSDLKAAGLKVTVQGATISVVDDKVVTKKGEAVSAPVAGTLSKLDIKPMKVGMNIVACYENKEIYEASVLDIDIDELRAKFVSAYTGAFNLAFNTGYFIAETIPLLIGKAVREAKALAIEAKVLSPETVEDFIASAARQAGSLKASLPEQPAEEKAKEAKPEGEAKEEPATEAKTEEKPAEEAKAEEKPKAEEAGKRKEEVKAEAKEEEKPAAEEKAEEKPAEKPKAEEKKE